MEPIEIELLARAAHEMNRLYCIGIGDHSQVPWEQAPEWQQSSAKNGVRGALAGNTPAQSHMGWLEEKKATGWKYGPVKDADKKEHPCMVDYADLPEEQRAKDDVFISTVRSLARALGVECKPAETETTIRLTLRKKLFARASQLLDAGNHGEACMLTDTAQRLQ